MKSILLVLVALIFLLGQPAWASIPKEKGLSEKIETTQGVLTGEAAYLRIAVKYEGHLAISVPREDNWGLVITTAIYDLDKKIIQAVELRIVIFEEERNIAIGFYERRGNCLVLVWLDERYLEVIKRKICPKGF